MDAAHLAAKCGSESVHAELAQYTPDSSVLLSILFLSVTATTADNAGFLSSQISSLAELRFFWQLEISAVTAVTAVEINWVWPSSWILSSGFLRRMPLNPLPSLLLLHL